MFLLSAVEDRNTPLSQRSGKRKASSDDESVQSKKRKLDPSAMFTAKYQEKEKLGEGGFGCVFAGNRKVDNLNVGVTTMFLHTQTHTHTHSTVTTSNQKVLFVSRMPSSA